MSEQADQTETALAFARGVGALDVAAALEDGAEIVRDHITAWMLDQQAFGVRMIVRAAESTAESWLCSLFAAAAEHVEQSDLSYHQKVTAMIEWLAALTPFELADQASEFARAVEQQLGIRYQADISTAARSAQAQQVREEVAGVHALAEQAREVRRSLSAAKERVTRSHQAALEKVAGAFGRAFVSDLAAQGREKIERALASRHHI